MSHQVAQMKGQVFNSKLSRRNLLMGALAAACRHPDAQRAGRMCPHRTGLHVHRNPRHDDVEAYPDQIRANLEAFTAGTDIEVELSLIPNVGYVSALQTRLLGGDSPDVYYNFAYASTSVRRPGAGPPSSTTSGAPRT